MFLEEVRVNCLHVDRPYARPSDMFWFTLWGYLLSTAYWQFLLQLLRMYSCLIQGFFLIKSRTWLKNALKLNGLSSPAHYIACFTMEWGKIEICAVFWSVNETKTDVVKAITKNMFTILWQYFATVRFFDKCKMSFWDMKKHLWLNHRLILEVI